MIKTLLLFLVFDLFANVSWGQNHQRKYTPHEMRQDIDSMVKYLEAAHPNPFYRYPTALFLKDVERVKSKLLKSLDEVNFYLAIEPLLSKLDDGHTDLHILQYYNSLNPLLLPYNFKLSTKVPFISCPTAMPGIKSQLPYDVEIISINNISADKIVNDIIDLNTGENRLFRAEFGATRFYFYLEALYKANGIYRIKYKHNGMIHLLTLHGLRKKDLDEIAKMQPDSGNGTYANFSLQILPGDSTAVINFKSFEWDGFKNFTDSAFTVIRHRHVQNIIINLMDDSGGDSDVGDAFFQYILNKPFFQYQKVLAKNSHLLKQRLRDHRIGKSLDSADKALLAKPNGLLDTTFYDKISIGDNPLRFNGRVILLVNIETYSSAADFAQCFKFYKRGIVIGEETGGLIKSYGDIVSAKLPNSKLELSVSSKLYYDVGAAENDWQGVVPDIISPPETALKRALEYIRENEVLH
jgi:hypothetical protein